MRRISVIRNKLFAAMVGFLLAGPVLVHAEKVYLIKVDGAIGPATASYISRAIDIATEGSGQCLVIELDTPGGLVDTTKAIITKFLAAKIPIVVYVTPSGASAGSAGCFIVLAADVAAMAPTTNIGAAHPVQIGAGGDVEKMDDIMKQKLENYMSSYIEMIAEKRKRNVKWAISSVVESSCITAEVALQTNVIDIIAVNLPDLLKQLDGRDVNGKKLMTATASVEEIMASTREKILQMIWRPEVMYILMLIAMYGIIGELSNPGAILPGVAGAIAVLLVLYMSSVLPMNIAGLALIGLSMILFTVDIFAPTHGVLTFGGILAFFLGSVLMFDRMDPVYRISMVFLVPATLLTAAFFLFIVGSGLRAQYLPSRVGSESMIGQIVKTESLIDSRGGTVMFEGELWNAVCDVSVGAGQNVAITETKGLLLKVRPVINKEVGDDSGSS
ncbi:MAG: nodulation protein NfeD [bacterium]